MTKSRISSSVYREDDDEQKESVMGDESDNDFKKRRVTLTRIRVINDQ